MSDQAGTVKAMCVRPGKGVDVVEIQEAVARVGKGLEGDERANGKRGITFLASEQWSDALAELDAELFWGTRRANVLTEGIDLSAVIGKKVRVGEVELQIWAETKPCGLMDQLHDGLRQALEPDCRGGVHGEVLKAGAIRVGASIAIV